MRWRYQSLRPAMMDKYSEKIRLILGSLCCQDNRSLGERLLRQMSKLKRWYEMGTNKACDAWTQLFKPYGCVELNDHNVFERVPSTALTNRFDALFTLQHHRPRRLLRPESLAQSLSQSSWPLAARSAL